MLVLMEGTCAVEFNNALPYYCRGLRFFIPACLSNVSVEVDITRAMNSFEYFTSVILCFCMVSRAHFSMLSDCYPFNPTMSLS